MKQDIKKQRIRNTTFFAFTISLLFSFTSNGQSKKLNDSTNNALLQAAQEIMISASTCSLITLDREGRPRARAMDPFDPEDDFTVWFGTNPKSRKVEQIKSDPKVTLYYLDGDVSGYVMIHGNAQIVNDQKEKDKRWKKEWEAFYPNINDGYVLIKVTPEWIEVINESRGIIGDPVTWKPPQVRIRPK